MHGAVPHGELHDYVIRPGLEEIYDFKSENLLFLSGFSAFCNENVDSGRGRFPAVAAR